MVNEQTVRIAVDFDGTVAELAYPEIGEPRKDAKYFINKLYDEGYTIMLNTCRTGDHEILVKDWMKEQGIKYHTINTNLKEDIEFYGCDSRKISADVYIDDKCVAGLPSWEEIYDIITNKFNPPRVIKTQENGKIK